MKKIYLDFNASTPIASEVLQAMHPFLTDHHGNPSSNHWAGVPAKTAVEQARNEVAGLLDCSPEEIIFTSGGTESNNHAIKGAFFALKHRGTHIITTQIEHPSVIQPCQFLEKLGAKVTYVPVDQKGKVDPESIRNAIASNTILISVMHANNEVGTIQDIRAIAQIAHEKGILVHTDAAQSTGKIPALVSDLGIDLLSIAGHKTYAPKGIGALYIRRGVNLESLVHGAQHEAGRRAGTENVPYIVGLGAACDLARSWIGTPQVGELRDHFWRMLQEEFGERIVLNGHLTDRLPNTLNVSFIDKSGAEILSQMDNIAATTGSACHEDAVEMSPVLKAMKVPPETGMGAIRFSLGRTTTKDEIESVVNQLKAIVT